MAKILSERNGTRKFIRYSQWNIIDYTIISKKHRFAQYVDDTSGNPDKLNLTYFHVGTTMYPLRRFAKFDSPIVLADLSTLSRIDPETGLLLEIRSDKTQVRLYKEITTEV